MRFVEHVSRLQRFGGSIRTITVSLLGVAAVVAGLVLIRQQRAPDEGARVQEVPPGESTPASISLERLRELGY